MGFLRWIQKTGSTGSIARWVAKQARRGQQAGWTLEETIQGMLHARYGIMRPSPEMALRLRAELKVSPPSCLNDLAKLIFNVEMGEQANSVRSQCYDVIDEVLEERGASQLVFTK